MGIFDLFRPNRKPGEPSRDSVSAAADAQAQADALVDQGNALCDQGDLQGGLKSYEAALALVPGLARAHLNVGNAMLAQGDAARALAAYSEALRYKPNYAAAHYNIGNASLKLGDLTAAVSAYRSATDLDPDFADAWVALGNAQDDLGLLDEAVTSYGRALELRPDYAEVHINAGNALRKLGRLDHAATCCRRALALKPALEPALIALGSILQDQQDGQAALQCFRQAAAGGSATAQALAYHCANQLCDWSSRASDEAALIEMVGRGAPALPPFYLLSLEPPTGNAPDLQRRAAARFAETTLRDALARPVLQQRHDAGATRRLHIGYLSADFHEHATMHLLRGVLAAHDRTRFRVTAYSYGGIDDAVTAEVRRTCERFRDLRSMSDEHAAKLIAGDEVDILVDLKGFTRHARMGIAARRPAPLIVSWLGYPGTLGLPALADYVVGDPIVTPASSRTDFSEALALMPNCYQPNEAQRPVAARPTRAEAGLPADRFVFCSLNQSYKFNPPTFDVWCRLLNDVPGSVLWLLPSSAATASNVRREIALRAVDPDRVVFGATLPLPGHLARLPLADLALDTFPVNSHTTGSDALWAGVPMVTRTGRTFASRVGASLLNAAGLPELVTPDWDQYLALATSLAQNPLALQALRRKLDEGRAELPLFDTGRFTRDLERLYRAIQQAGPGRQDVIVSGDEPKV